MKYTILGFQQSKLLENDLDIVDALILRTIKDMYSSASMEFKIKGNEKYMWVKIDYLLKQIPILGSRSNLTRRIKKYEDMELLNKLFTHSKNGVKGSYSYIAPTIKLDALQDFDGYVNLTQGVSQNDIGGMSERPNKDTSITDTSITDTKDCDGAIFKDIVHKYQDNGFGLINAGTSETLTDLTDMYSNSWVLDAFDIAIDNNARNLGYVKGILKKWKAEGKDNVKTVTDAYAGMPVF